MQSVCLLCSNPKSGFSAAISFPWYESQNRSLPTLSVGACRRSVKAKCYCRNCLSAHAGVLLKLNANTLLGCAVGRHLRKTLAKRKGSKRTTPRHRPSRYAAFGTKLTRTTPRHRPSITLQTIEKPLKTLCVCLFLKYFQHDMYMHI